MDVLRAKLARHALRHRAQPGFGAGERRVADAAAYARGCACEEDTSLPARQHQTRRLAPGEKACVASQLPDFTENSFGCVEQGEIDIAADVENANLERCVRVRGAQEGGDVIFFAGIEAARDHRSARSFDIGDERCELVGVTPAGEDREAFGRKSFGNRRADEIAGADDRGGGVAFGHAVPPDAQPLTKSPSSLVHYAGVGWVRRPSVRVFRAPVNLPMV